MPQSACSSTTLVPSEMLNNQQLEVTNNCSTAPSVSPVLDLSGFDLLIDDDDDENNLSKYFFLYKLFCFILYDSLLN